MEDTAGTKLDPSEVREETEEQVVRLCGGASILTERGERRLGDCTERTDGGGVSGDI